MSRVNESPVLEHWHTPESDSPTIVSADGPRFTDDEGNEYLDFVSQLACVNAGHGNENIIRAIQEQVGVAQYVGPKFGSDVRTHLAERITEITPGDLDDIYFAVSGSEANESAIQFARKYQDAPKVLTRWRSYHGSTYGAGGISGDPQTRTFEAHAATTGSVKFLPPLSYRSPWDADTPEELGEKAADHLEFVVRNEDPDSIAAIMMEPVGGASGAFPLPPGYAERVRELCDEHDILLIADEVITGFGRTGEWFGSITENLAPDILTFAKGVTSSYVPLAGLAMRPEIADLLRSEGIGVGQTFAGHPVACAAGLAAIEEYETGLLENVRERAPYLADRLSELADAHEVVGDVRGRGFLWALEITDPETGEPFFDPRVDSGTNPVTEVQREAMKNGVLFGTGRPSFQITAYPTFVTERDDIDEAVTVLDDALTEVFG
jgi:taurine--2-oxoglutarate transaminase